MLLSYDDCKAHQKLLKRVAQNLGIQVEVVKESSLTLVDILTAMGLSRVALPLSEAIMDSIQALWQTCLPDQEEVLCLGSRI